MLTSLHFFERVEFIQTRTIRFDIQIGSAYDCEQPYLLLESILMSYETYKIIHLVGLSLLFVSLGGIFVHYFTSNTAKRPRFLMISHGIGMLIVFIAGFGLHARLGLGWPWPTWIYGKLGIWLFAGILPLLIRTRLRARILAWVGLPALMLLGAFFAVIKP